MDQRDAVNWWVRIQVGALTLFLVAIAAYRVWVAQPPAQIDAGLLAILALVIVLILSEAFDNFSVGKLLSFSKRIEKKEKEVEKLEDQNARLLSQLISISTQQAQSQTHINVDGDYHAAPRVQKATVEEVEESRKREASADVVAEGTVQGAEPVEAPSISFRQMEQLAFDKYVALKGLNEVSLLREAKLITDFRDLDSISNSPLVFDGYISYPGRELFIEIRSPILPPSFRDRLYVMLSKIDHYRRKKGVEAHLDLVLVSDPSRQIRALPEERLMNEFQPAIASGLLQITKIELTEEEIAAAPVAAADQLGAP